MIASSSSPSPRRAGRALPVLALGGLSALLTLVVVRALGGAGDADADAAGTWGFASAWEPAFDFRENGLALAFHGAGVVFFLLLAAAAWKGLRRAGLAGSPEGPRVPLRRRLQRLLAVTVTQRRLLGVRRLGIAHAALSVGFLVLMAGSLTLMIDAHVLQPMGFALPRGRVHAVFQGSLEVFGIALVLGSGALLCRLPWRTSRSAGTRPQLATVLSLLLVLGVSGFALEGLRMHLEQGPDEPWIVVGTAVQEALASTGLAGEAGERSWRILWWSHALLALAFLAAVPLLHLRHALLAPLQAWASAGDEPGTLTPPFLLEELVRTGVHDIRVGASSASELPGRDRLAMSACADTGACEEACPAHDSGTPLSPRRLVGGLQDLLRSRDGARSPCVDVLGEDAIWSCTTCGACTQACPLAIDPMRPILEMRRGLAAAGRLGVERTRVLANLMRAGNPYGAPASARAALPGELDAPTIAERPDAEWIYWVGCAATFDSRSREIARSMVAILRAAGISFAVLGGEEGCSGDAARRLGEEGLFQQLALANIATFEKHGVRRILTHCAHCFHVMANEYPALGAKLEVVHHAAFLRELAASGALPLARRAEGALALHDACHVGRLGGGTVAPRELLSAVTGEAPRELAHSGAEAQCCGGGGAGYWYSVPREEPMAASRLREASAAGAETLVSECPFCLKMLEGACGGSTGSAPRVRDVAEVVADCLAGEAAAGRRGSA